MNTDEQLFDAMVAGDKRAPTALYDRYFLPVRGYFINKVADPAVVDDLVQDTFVVILTRPGNFQRRSSFRSFLFGVAHNVLRDHYRKHASHRRGQTDDIDDIPVADLGPGVSTLVSDRAETQRLIHALRRIDSKYQSVFEMFYWQELSAREIGEAINIPEGTARSRLRLAKRALAEQLRLGHETAAQLLASFRDIAAWAREVRVLLDKDHA
jgi:RNA polymerase sigma-70 factor (ECF subfamily)